MVKKGAARAAADKGADISDELLPSTNGSQHDLHQFLRALAGDMECLEADEVYLITTGAAMASGGNRCGRWCGCTTRQIKVTEWQHRRHHEWNSWP